MRIADLDYELPNELIARYPSKQRESSRLLVVGSQANQHLHFFDLGEVLPPNALLVVNDTRVIPARLFGRKETGGRVELLLVRRLDDEARLEGSGAAGESCQRWVAMARSSKPLRIGATVTLTEQFIARVESRNADDGMLVVALYARGADELDALIAAHGHVPLPPYMQRADEFVDRERYQTVYARAVGAVAAPTAGLHFSQDLLTRLDKQGVQLAKLTLHVGPGTFRPVAVEDLNDHPMHREEFEVSERVVKQVQQARERGAPVIAVGTTVVRALESAVDEEGELRAKRGSTRLLIQPGYQFKVVDGLITNFHLPRSTLLALVCAFASRDRVMGAYREAIEAAYRFYSYGDAMYLEVSDTVGRKRDMNG